MKTRNSEREEDKEKEKETVKMVGNEASAWVHWKITVYLPGDEETHPSTV